MIPTFEILGHSSIKLIGSKTLYIDPFNIVGGPKDADYVFCTHPHYDHFSPEDIKKVSKERTLLIVPETAIEEAESVVNDDLIRLVEPGHHYQLGEIIVETTYAYNLEKSYHKKEKKWVGYLIYIDGLNCYIAGDTDNIPEIQDIKCDVAFLPIGGTFTMNVEEAAELANKITAETIIPVHYGSIVGKKEYGERFAELVTNKKVKLMI